MGTQGLRRGGALLSLGWNHEALLPGGQGETEADRLWLGLQLSTDSSQSANKTDSSVCLRGLYVAMG